MQAGELEACNAPNEAWAQAGSLWARFCGDELSGGNAEASCSSPSIGFWYTEEVYVADRCLGHREVGKAGFLVLCIMMVHSA